MTEKWTPPKAEVPASAGSAAPSTAGKASAKLLDDSSPAPATEKPQPSRPARQRAAWRVAESRPGWQLTLGTAGGSITSFDPVRHLRADPATAARCRAALSQVAVYRSEWAERRNAVDSRDRAALESLRRIVSRGANPPVDPGLEQHILRTAGLGDFIGRARHPGDLRPVLTGHAQLPTPQETKSAIAVRGPFELDEELGLRRGGPLLHPSAELPFVRDWMPTALPSDSCHWLLPQSPMGALAPEDDDDHRRVDFVVAHPFHDAFAIEIDGRQHSEAESADQARDEELSTAGMQVFRVPAHECVAPENQQPTLSRLAAEWPSSDDSSSLPTLSTLLLVWGPTVANRILLATLEALEHGWLSGQQWKLEIEEPLGIAAEALRTTLEWVDAVASVWGAGGVAPDHVHLRADDTSFLIERKSCGQYEVTTSPSGTMEQPDVRLVIEPFHGPLHRLPDRRNIPQVVVRSVLLPVDLLQIRPVGARRRVVAEPDAIPSDALKRILQGVFGKREFQPDGPEPRGQEMAIRRILTGRDAIVLLPTGAGKSLIYQFAGLLLPGTTIVVDPIVSLIEDQLYGLSQLGIDRAIGLTSHDTRIGSHDAKLDRVLSGDALFVFVAPERLQQRVFQQGLRALSASSPINLAVVDEAHCVSEWGHDFRTSYLSLGQTLRETAKDDTGSAPPIIALTGTASRPVLADVLTALDIDRSDPDAVITPRDFDRPELNFSVVEADDSEILSRLTGVLRGLPTRFTTLNVPRDPTEFLAPRGADTTAGIVFCQTVNAPRRGAAAIAQGLTRNLGFAVPLYSGTAPRGAKDHERIKRRAAAAFKHNRIPLLVATKAYGMGIDKPNVRFIIHIGTSSSIESYYQEAGRSGRDRREAHCIILRTPGDSKVHEFFDSRTFRGVDAEVAAVEQVIQLLGSIGERREVQIPMGGADEQRERALHRLRVLGVLDRYLVEFGAKKYACTLSDISLAGVDRALVSAVRAVQPARSAAIAAEVARLPVETLATRVLGHSRKLIEFIYDTIVSSRRRATEEMLRLADASFDGEEIRRRILAYMDIGDVGRDLTELLEREVFLYGDWLELLGQMSTPDDARDWRGATARLLESDPNHPGLLLGRALAEVLADVGDSDVFSLGVVTSFREARTHYDTPVEEAESTAISILDWTRDRHPSWTVMLYDRLDEMLGDASTGALVDYEYQCLRSDGVHQSEAAAITNRRLRRSRRSITSLASTLCDLPA